MLINLWHNLEVHPDDLEQGSPLVIAKETDPELAIANYIQRQEMLAKALLGQAHPDDYLDCLLEQGLDVDFYLEDVTDYLDYSGL